MLLSQPAVNTNKGLRDKAMLELLYATGIRVSELISLKLSDVNLSASYIHCQDFNKDRVVPFGNVAKNVLKVYIRDARPAMVANNEEDALFTNCNGIPMSRQGFWKLLKKYAKNAGIQSDITLLQPTWWPMVRICGPYRRCWDIRIYPQHRYTHG